MDWTVPEKPAQRCENLLVDAILNGTFPVNSSLPPERELAEKLGVTRPTLREVLQRLARAGWLEIHHGKSTRVRDYNREGNILILAAMIARQNPPPHSFVTQALAVRASIAPDYTRLAIGFDGARLAELLRGNLELPEDARRFTLADWDLHYQLSVSSRNPIYTLMLNSFYSLSLVIGDLYFKNPSARDCSRRFYADLQAFARSGDAEGAGELTRRVMQESIRLWEQAQAD